jgi:hypothetical protein
MLDGFQSPSRIRSLGWFQSDAAKVGAGGGEAIDQADVPAAGQRGEAADAPIVLRLKSPCLRRECAGEEVFSRCKQEAPTWRTANLKLRYP